jgi:hypothetical protein
MTAKIRQGRRAPGKTQTSISLRLDLLDWARAEAQKDGRSLSNWIEQLIRSKMPAEGGARKR